MSNNVGDIKTFTLNGTSTADIRYVWNWWDGSTDCTTANYTEKTLNKGGNPADSYYVRYSVQPVDNYGQSRTYTGSLVVNNPPSIVLGSATLSKNGQEVSFFTTASVEVYDLEGQTLAFEWTVDGVFYSNGDRTYLGAINGTYAGTRIGTVWGTRASLTYEVDRVLDLGLTITDAQGGITDMEFPVYGYRLTDADSTYSPVGGPLSQTGDASSLPVVTIGEDASFSVYARTPPSRTRFVWVFAGTNGWAVPSSSNGVTSTLPDGSIQNTIVKATTGETAGHKVADVDIVDLDHNTTAHIEIPIDLIPNYPPIIDAVNFLPAAPTAGDWVKFSVDYVDPNADISTVRWDFTNPSTTLWGRTVWINTYGLASGASVVGTCTVFDRFSAEDSATFNVTLA